MKKSVSIIGAGRLGGALAIALEKRGYKIVNLVSRSAESAKILSEKLSSAPEICSIENLFESNPSEVVFITTPDPEIEKTAENLSRLKERAAEQTVFLHTSGALSSEILVSLRKINAKVGSMHPLVSVSDAFIGAEKFRGAFFCLEGDAEVVEVSKKIVADLEGNSFSIPTAQKSLYHAAAVICAGHMVALFDLAAETLSDCGLEKAEARKILLPLVRSTIENLQKQTPASALTGTFARADLATMQRHLESLQNKSALPIYVELGKRSLRLAAQQGAEPETIEKMRQELAKIDWH